MSKQKSHEKSLAASLKRGLERITKFEKIRFALVGVLNTSVDFVILIVLATLFGVPSVIANIISTSAALAVSYLLNKKAVFKNTDTGNRRQLLLFIIVTLFGLWVLQTVIISFASSLLSAWLNTSAAATIVLILAKALATIVSLAWNYLWYSRVIFSQKNQTNR